MPQYSLFTLIKYFLKLGATGFGGPVALVGYMERDLVENRNWFTPNEFSEGLALAQLAPGPLATQLAIYLGWLKYGIFGASVVSIAFVLPSFLIVLVLSYFYVLNHDLPWLQALFYGIGASVIGVIANSSIRLLKRTLKTDCSLWGLAAISAVVTVCFEKEFILLMIFAGLFYIFLKSQAKPKGLFSLSVLPAVLTTGLHGETGPHALSQLFLFFLKSGAVVFGSGLAIVPFLHGGVVNQFHWLSEKQFLDAIAIAMITPGPVVITVAFIGYLAAGSVGATLAAVGVFLPCYIFVIGPAPYFKKISKYKNIKFFIDGVTAAALGALAGAAIVIARKNLIDAPTIALALLSFVVLYKTKKIPEPIVIAACGAIGFLFKGL